MLRRLGLLLLLVLIGIGSWSYLRPVPAVAANISVPTEETVTGTVPALPWPSTGSGAVGVSGLGLIATSGDVAPAPEASVAKVMTALVVMKDKPFAKGETGPLLTMTDQDVATYNADKADKQSVVEVTAGETLTEFEALEALLIPSANNIAETLARWDAGTVAAFVTKMNQHAADLHLSHTTFADPAGVSLQTVSTPSDLLLLGMEAMKDGVLAQIVGLPQATLPVAGTVYNVNSALGQGGIIGIKTGSGLNSGANFLFAAVATVDNHQLTIYGCVMGQPTLDMAFREAKGLIGATQAALTVRPVVLRGDSIGAYDTPWGGHSDLLSTVDVTLVEWPGMILHQRLDAPSLVIENPMPSATHEGSLHMVLGDYKLDVPLVTASAMYPPGKTWRLLRIKLF
jgi:serine-type D-Ala-D-Ala carboxypeptidase (penicillin-binding protein 5/6)